MTGHDVVERALILLNYTTPEGATDNKLNAEQIRRALPILNTVLADLMYIQRLPTVQVTQLADELPVSTDAAVRLVVPGVAMYLAQSEGDADSYNRFAGEYYQRRSSLERAPERVRDVSPRVIL